MAEEGVSISNIADFFGVGVSTINRWTKEARTKKKTEQTAVAEDNSIPSAQAATTTGLSKRRIQQIRSGKRNPAQMSSISPHDSMPLDHHPVPESPLWTPPFDNPDDNQHEGVVQYPADYAIMDNEFDTPLCDGAKSEFDLPFGEPSEQESYTDADEQETVSHILETILDRLGMVLEAKELLYALAAKDALMQAQEKIYEAVAVLVKMEDSDA